MARYEQNPETRASQDFLFLNYPRKTLEDKKFKTDLSANAKFIKIPICKPKNQSLNTGLEICSLVFRANYNFLDKKSESLFCSFLKSASFFSLLCKELQK